MEFMPEGSLDHHIFSGLHPHDELKLFEQVLDGLQYIHGRKLTHRDVKPGNILFRSIIPLHVKLADFGLAKAGPALRSFCGTGIYMAPEIDNRGSSYRPEVDLWSLGVVMLELIGDSQRIRKSFSKRLPNKYSNAVIIDTILTEMIRKAADYHSSSLIDFIKWNLLRPEPEERTPADACLRDLHTLIEETEQATEIFSPQISASSEVRESNSPALPSLKRSRCAGAEDDGVAGPSRGSRKVG